LEKQKVIIANDRYGSKNLFYVINSDRILYSSEIKAILEDISIIPKLNHESVVELFTFSFMLGNKTLFNGIELFPPASILIYDLKKNKIQIVGYWDFKFDHDKEPKNLETYLTEFNLLMEKVVERRMADKDKIGIFLSGGVDSRLMAGFAQRVAERTGKELISFTFGTKGGWQGKIAMQVADKLGIENGFYEIPADMIANYAEEVVLKGGCTYEDQRRSFYFIIG
jgi:asparagine synthase (glutamine-hydrolysing)